MRKNILKSVIAFSLIGALTLGGSAQLFAAAPTPKDYVGYLMDAHCAKQGFDDETKKINLKLYPEKHTTSCLKMNMCMMETLGISVKEGKEYKFYKFDKKGSQTADDNIMMKTKRKFGNKIAVKGIINKDIMTISSIKEVK